MDEQSDLFAVPGDTNPITVFPEFEIERPNCDYSGLLTTTEMVHVLQRLGFTVGQMRYHTSQILAFSGAHTESRTLFEVSYPNGWKLTEDLSHTVYTGDHNPVRQILDTQGHVRGIVHCGLDVIPLSAVIYTRYSVWSGVPLNFAQIDFDFDRDAVHSVVVDRTRLSQQRPDKLSTIEYADRRWLLGEKHPHLLDMSPEDRQRWIDANISLGEIRVEVNGSTLWLDEHFPEWRDPTAYWPA